MANRDYYDGYGTCLARCYKPVYRAYVRTDSLDVTFSRLYEDIRHIMSDDPRENWVPDDDFIIRITGLKTTKKVTRGQIGSPAFDTEYTRTEYHTEKTGEFEIRTKDRRLANWIWYLAKKKGYTFEQFAEMDRVGMFREDGTPAA